MTITFGGPRMGAVMILHWYFVSPVGEEFVGLNTDHFKRFIFVLESSLEAIL